MALNVIDNGFLYMDHIRIPRNNLLMKYCQVCVIFCLIFIHFAKRYIFSSIHKKEKWY